MLKHAVSLNRTGGTACTGMDVIGSMMTTMSSRKLKLALA